MKTLKPAQVKTSSAAPVSGKNAPAKNKNEFKMSWSKSSAATCIGW